MEHLEIIEKDINSLNNELNISIKTIDTLLIKIFDLVHKTIKIKKEIELDSDSRIFLNTNLPNNYSNDYKDILEFNDTILKAIKNYNEIVISFSVLIDKAFINNAYNNDYILKSNKVILYSDIFSFINNKSSNEYIKFSKDIADLNNIKNYKELIFESLSENSTKPLYSFFPKLKLISKRKIYYDDISIRTKKILDRNNILNWNNLLVLKLRDIKKLKSLGNRTYKEIIIGCAKETIKITTSFNTSFSYDTLPYFEKINNNSLIDIEMYLKILSSFSYSYIHWTNLLKQEENFGVLFKSCCGNKILYNLQNKLFSSVEKMRILCKTLEQKNLIIDLNDFYNSFTNLQIYILNTRILIFKNQIKIKEIASKFNLTNNRIRQVEIHTKYILKNKLKNDKFKLLHWFAAYLVDYFGNLFPYEDFNNHFYKILKKNFLKDDKDIEITKRLIAFIVGPFYLENGILFTKEVSSFNNKYLIELLDSYNSIPYDKLKSYICKKMGIKEKFFDYWLNTFSISNIVFKNIIIFEINSKSEQLISVLRLIGISQTIDELIEKTKITITRQTIMKKFVNDKRVIRTSKNKWGLKHWGFEEYSSIEDSIINLIKQNFGTIKKEILVNDLKEKFQINKNSINTYLNTDIFKVINGNVYIDKNHKNKY